MATKRYRFVAHEVDGVEQSFPQELDFPTSDMLLGVRGLVTLPTIQATANSTLTLTATSDLAQFFTGTTAGQIVKLPNATTLTPGHRYEFYNTSSQAISIKDNADSNLLTVGQTSIAYFILQNNSTAGGSWVYWQVFVSSIATGILNYNLSQTTPFATTSASYVPVTGFTLTPVAGTYAVWVSGSWEVANTSAVLTGDVHIGGAPIADSQRIAQSFGSGKAGIMATMTIVTANGSQAVDFRVYTSASTLTVRERSLILIRMGA